MALYPRAVVKLVDRYKPGGSSNQLMRAYRRYQAHTAVSNGSLFTWMNQPGHAVSHFYVLADGIVEQYIDTLFRSSATLDGNPDTISVETEDVGPPFPPWNTNGSDVPAWTGAQVKALAELGAWTFDTHRIKVVLCPNSLPGSEGFSYHRQGIDPWRVPGGEVWSKSTGKVCPGDRRVAQWKNDVIPLTAGILSGDDMATAEEVWDYNIKSVVDNEDRDAKTLLKFTHGNSSIARENTRAIIDEQKAAKLRDEAILAAIEGADGGAVLARIDELAVAESARDSNLLAVVRQLVEAPADVTAEEIVRKIGQLLSATPTPPPAEGT